MSDRPEWFLLSDVYVLARLTYDERLKAVRTPTFVVDGKCGHRWSTFMGEHVRGVQLSCPICPPPPKPPSEVEELRQRLAEAERECERLRVCSTCGGDPTSHPSGLLCICENGTRAGEVDGMRKALFNRDDQVAALRIGLATYGSHVEVCASGRSEGCTCHFQDLLDRFAEECKRIIAERRAWEREEVAQFVDEPQKADDRSTADAASDRRRRRGPRPGRRQGTWPTYAELEQQVAALRGVLADVQWNGHRPGDCVLYADGPCDGHQSTGHGMHCPVRRALTDAAAAASAYAERVRGEERKRIAHDLRFRAATITAEGEGSITAGACARQLEDFADRLTKEQ